MIDLKAIAKDAAERVHKNGGCVPQMAFAPILFALEDALSTTPARAEAQDEGAAGEFVEPYAWIWRDMTRLGLGFTRDPSVVSIKREQGCEIQPLYAHPSPTPADADRVRIAVEALEPFADFVTPAPKWMKDADVVSAGSPLARKQLTFGDCRRAAEAFAALKSTAAKEGGEHDRL